MTAMVVAVLHQQTLNFCIVHTSNGGKKQQQQTFENCDTMNISQQNIGNGSQHPVFKRY